MDSLLNFELADKIQVFILEHIDETDFSVQNVISEFNYSERHLNRVYKQFTGKTIREYINTIRLSESTYEIERGKSVLQTALNAGYETNEGYSKAFYKKFGKTPSEYKNGKGMIKRFIPYPIRHSYEHYYNREENKMGDTIVCTAFIADKPKRKMIILRSQKATDYWSFCQEMGCDWEGYLNSNTQKIDTVAIVKLPKGTAKEGYSDIAAAIEVSVDYEDDDLDEKYEIIELEPCKQVYFKSQPYANADDFCKYIDAVNEAYNNFDFGEMGLTVDFTAGPYMNFGAEPERGAKIAYPVREITE